MKKRDVFPRNILLLVAAVFSIVLLSFFHSDEILPTAFVVADCMDADADGYYDEACQAADLDCAAAEALVSSSSSQQSVEADEDYVVYKDDVNGNWDIYLYDLSSAETLVVSEESVDEVLPRISEGVVVWLADSDIFSFAVSSGERSVLVEDSFTQSAATIFSGKVYWVDSQSGSTDIYTLDMGGSCSIDLGDCADDDA